MISSGVTLLKHKCHFTPIKSTCGQLNKWGQKTGKTHHTKTTRLLEHPVLSLEHPVSPTHAYYYNYDTCAPRRLKPLATRLFVQQFARANIKVNMKDTRYLFMGIHMRPVYSPKKTSNTEFVFTWRHDRDWPSPWLLHDCILCSLTESYDDHQHIHRIMYVLALRTLYAFMRGLFSCLFPELRSNEGNKQRVLMHGHQGWNVRHGLCHIYMIYVYIWVVYSFCLFCCLFIIVTTWFVALYKPCKPKPKFR